MRLLTKLLALFIASVAWITGGKIALTHAEVSVQKKQKTVEVFYTPFTFYQCWGPSTTVTIRHSFKGYNNRVIVAVDEQSGLYGSLDKRGSRAQFDANDVRLLVPAQNGHPEYAVDSKGVVRVNGSSYSIQPVALLSLSYLLAPKLTAKMDEYAKRSRAEKLKNCGK
ncbi:MAG: hypothetical protein EOP06_22860 [Proteobacteria bacterium]|nr:MAG: hypothetical protein EOP06_22860 [Pseudomonadota bacterium]